MMNINFNGIKNLRVSVQKEKHTNQYCSNEISPLKPMISNGIILDAYLDDVGNKDLKKYHEILTRLGNVNKKDYFDKKDKSHISLLCYRSNFDRNKFPYSFVLNENPIDFGKDDVLPIFSFLAKITRKEIANPEYGPAKKQALLNLNKAIQENAEIYFDIKA